MDFYYGRISGNSARVAFGLHEAGAAFRVHLVDTPSGQNRAPAYLALNPMGKIPALTDGTVLLWESNAINWYVAEKHPEARLLPTSIGERAAVQRWLFFQTGHVTPACVRLFMATNRRVQEFWRAKPNLEAADGARRELARFLPVLEQALVDREWLEGAFSLADIAYAPHLWMIAEGGYEFDSAPAVRAWLDRMLARPAWRKSAEMIFGD